MLTSKQINWIALLPPEADFRFVQSFGQTIVRATGPGGVTIEMTEDDKTTAWGLYGAIQWTQDVVIHAT